MLESPHAAVGAAIATKIPNPIISIPLVLASHFLLDRVPHWNPHSYTETQKYGRITKKTTIFSIADVAVALGIGFWFAGRVMPNWQHALVILVVTFFSVLPDVAKAPYFLLAKRKGILKRYVDFERSLQVETNFVVGMSVQLIVILAAFLWVR